MFVPPLGPRVADARPGTWVGRSEDAVKVCAGLSSRRLPLATSSADDAGRQEVVSTCPVPMHGYAHVANSAVCCCHPRPLKPSSSCTAAQHAVPCGCATRAIRRRPRKFLYARGTRCCPQSNSILGRSHNHRPVPATDVEIRPPCPLCSGHGLARILAIKLDTRTITFECDTCHHKWDVTSPSPREQSIYTPRR